MRPVKRPAMALVVVAALVVMAATAGCSSSKAPATRSSQNTTSSANPVVPPSPSTTVAPAPAVAATAISIKGFAFQPTALAARVGDVITVSNADGTDHSVTAVDGSFDTGRFSDGTRTIRVDKAGRVEFKCQVHSFMPHGFIQVSG